MYKDSAYKSENDIFLNYPTWIDAWKKLHPLDHGFTFDTKKNTMLTREDPNYSTPHPYNQSRYDRLLFKSKNLTLSSISMLGTECTLCQDENEKSPVSVFPSDHFGLLVEFTFAKK